MKINKVQNPTTSNSSPASSVMNALGSLKSDGVTEQTLRDVFDSLRAAPAFPSTEAQRSALVDAYGAVRHFAAQDGGDLNHQSSALLQLLGSALGASRVTFSSDPKYVAPKVVAEKFVTRNVAEKYGWKQTEVYDSRDATEDWALSAKWKHFYHPDEATRDAQEARLVKYDFDLGVVENGTKTVKEIGVAMNRETGEILEVYIGRNAPKAPDAL